jgi:ribonuclease HI
MAEAAAILWAVELATLEKFDSIIVNGDAKVCLDALNGESIDNPWVISSVISNILVLSKTFASCCFCWVRREANEVAHSLAKFSPSPHVPVFCCNSSSIPSAVWNAWWLDSLFVCG